MSPRLKYATKKPDGTFAWLAASDRGQASPPPPPPPGTASTMFGYNTLDVEGLAKMQRWGKVPMARVYNSGNPLGAAHFQPGGLCYRGAGIGVAGVASSRRVNMSIIYDPATVTGPNSAKCTEVRQFAGLVPPGWYVQLVLYHEYNLHTTDRPGETAGTLTDFQRSHKLLAQAVVDGDAGNGRCVPVINPSWDAGNLKDAQSVPAADMPAGTQWHNDAYDNPRGQPVGYKKYGTTYNGTLPAQASYDIANRLGYTGAGYGWGIDEFNAPRRVAPKLATLDSTLGWGPLSPYDLDGSGQAKSITDYCTTLLGCPVPPTTVLLFTTNGNLWNQKFTTAGTASGDAPVGDPRHQGWPIDVDPSKPYAAYQAFINISA